MTSGRNLSPDACRFPVNCQYSVAKPLRQTAKPFFESILLLSIGEKRYTLFYLANRDYAYK